MFSDQSFDSSVGVLVVDGVNDFDSVTSRDGASILMDHGGIEDHCSEVGLDRADGCSKLAEKATACFAKTVGAELFPE